MVIATGTASGKSLGYQLPMLSAVLADDRARTLYLAPTKALAADQLRTIAALGLSGIWAATLDGDTPMHERDWVRRHANVLLSTGTCCTGRCCPSTPAGPPSGAGCGSSSSTNAVTTAGCSAPTCRWCCAVCAGSARTRDPNPCSASASATATDPGASAARLVGIEVRTIEEDSAPRGSRAFALWEPPLTAVRGKNFAPVRRAAGAEAPRLLADLVIEGARTLVFVRSRRGAEHAAIGLLPLFATCDRWDIGGVSTASHADTGCPTVFVYEGHPGGAGFAAHGHSVLPDWLRASLAAITACECRGGCPSCVQSPKCGNGNEPLDKDGASVVLRLVLSALDNPARR